MCDVLCIYSIVHKYDKPLSRVFIDFYASFQTPRQACTWSSDVIVQLDELIMINKQYRVTNLQSLFFFSFFQYLRQTCRHACTRSIDVFVQHDTLFCYFIFIFMFLCFIYFVMFYYFVFVCLLWNRA